MPFNLYLLFIFESSKCSQTDRSLKSACTFIHLTTFTQFRKIYPQNALTITHFQGVSKPKRGPSGPLEQVKMSKQLKHDMFLNNRFDILTSENNEIEMTTSTNNTAAACESTSTAEIPPVPRTRVPPIVVGSKYFHQLNDVLSRTKVSLYTMKLTATGIRLTLSKLDDYDLVLNALKDPANPLNFYTHDVNNKPQKFVVKGLPDMTNFDTVIRSKLKEINLVPDDIKKMTIKDPFFNQANYIVYFPKGTTSLKDLQTQVIAICNIVTVWQNYKTPRGPTQCHNCQMFGHGSRNCNLSPKCVKCGKNHKTTDCQVDGDDRQNIKCANCNDNHVASYSLCPARTEYVNMRQRQSASAARKSSNFHPNPIRPPPPNNEANYPAIIPKQRQTQAWFSQFEPSDASEPVADNKSRNERPRRATKKDNDRRPDEDLFSKDELFDIFKKLTSKLKLCRTRTEQIEVITELAFDYCMNNTV